MKLSTAVLFLSAGSAAAFAPSKASFHQATALASTKASTETKVRSIVLPREVVETVEIHPVLRMCGWTMGHLLVSMTTSPPQEEL